MALNVVMLGAPGAGKGTQAERFARKRGLPRISTGDILRQGIKDGLPVGLAAKATMDRGELVEDETMVNIVLDQLARADSRAGFVLDGFPRTVSQARSLDAIIEARKNGPLIVVDIVVPEDELVRRLAGRRICGQCGTNAEPSDGAGASCRRCGGELVYRVDDSDHVVSERLKIYERATKPIVDFYRGRPTLRMVDGAQNPDRVAQEIDATVDDAATAGTSASLEGGGR